MVEMDANDEKAFKHATGCQRHRATGSHTSWRIVGGSTGELRGERRLDARRRRNGSTALTAGNKCQHMSAPGSNCVKEKARFAHYYCWKAALWSGLGGGAGLQSKINSSTRMRFRVVQSTFAPARPSFAVFCLSHTLAWRSCLVIRCFLPVARIGREKLLLIRCVERFRGGAWRRRGRRSSRRASATALFRGERFPRLCDRIVAGGNIYRTSNWSSVDPEEFITGVLWILKRLQRGRVPSSTKARRLSITQSACWKGLDFLVDSFL